VAEEEFSSRKTGERRRRRRKSPAEWLLELFKYRLLYLFCTLSTVSHGIIFFICYMLTFSSPRFKKI
jgi:hypothetical protein